jgi:hypothetical protein
VNLRGWSGWPRDILGVTCRVQLVYTLLTSVCIHVCINVCVSQLLPPYAPSLQFYSHSHPFPTLHYSYFSLSARRPHRLSESVTDEHQYEASRPTALASEKRRSRDMARSAVCCTTRKDVRHNIISGHPVVSMVERLCRLEVPKPSFYRASDKNPW